MDFTNRGGQARTNNATSNLGGAGAPVASNASAVSPNSSGSSSDGGKKSANWARIGFMVLLFSGTILAIATSLFLAFGKGSYRESRFVNNDQLQAVFINVNGTNGGQVYFGNIQDMTSQYIRLTNVYYIQNQQSSTQDAGQAASAYNLVKLGCELHGPEDAMQINRSEVFFWENLKADSQVAQKVAEFKKQNPNGQKCTTANGQAQPAANTQNSAPATETAPTPATGTTAPKPTTTPPAPATTPPASNTNR